MRQILTLTLSDLHQRVRDKSVFIFGLVVPLALMFVFNLVFGGTNEIDLEPVTVAVSSPAGDSMAPIVTKALQGLGDQAGFTVTVYEVDAATGRRQVKDGDANVSLVFPEGFATATQAGDPVSVAAVRGDQARLETDIVLSVVDGVLAGLADGTVTAQAGAATGIQPDQLAQLAQQAATDGPAYDLKQGEASSVQLDGGGSLVAGQAGLFLLFTVGFGVTSLLVERETGTLSRLRSMPMPSAFIIISKALVSLVMGAISTAVLLVAGGLLFDVDFGSPLAVAALVVAVSAAGTSVMFVIARVARTSEQAGVASSIVALVLGIGGGAFTPISASGVLSTILDLNPVAALLRGLGITSSGGGLNDLGAPLAIMVGFAAVMVVAARLVPDRGALS